MEQFAFRMRAFTVCAVVLAMLVFTAYALPQSEKTKPDFQSVEEEVASTMPDTSAKEYLGKKAYDPNYPIMEIEASFSLAQMISHIFDLLMGR